jgi:hypothetical protein
LPDAVVHITGAAAVGGGGFAQQAAFVVFVAPGAAIGQAPL